MHIVEGHLTSRPTCFLPVQAFMLLYCDDQDWSEEEERELGHCLRAARLSSYFIVNVVPHIPWLYQGQEHLWRAVLLHRSVPESSSVPRYNLNQGMTVIFAADSM